MLMPIFAEYSECLCVNFLRGLARESWTEDCCWLSFAAWGLLCLYPQFTQKSFVLIAVLHPIIAKAGLFSCLTIFIQGALVCG